jgi:hypothetical protein
MVLYVFSLGADSIKKVFGKSVGQDNADFVWSAAQGDKRGAVVNLLKSSSAKETSGVKSDPETDQKVANDTAVVDQAIGLVDQHAGQAKGMFTAVKSGGPAGAYEYIKEQAGDIKATFLETMIGILVPEVIKKAVEKLAVASNPVGGIAQLALTAYETVKFIIARFNAMVELIDRIITSFEDMARGAVDKAATKVETSLGLTLPLAIEYLT